MVDEGSEIRKRRITMADGRYLIFYTFGDEEEIKTSSSSEMKTPAEETSGEDKHV